MTSVSIGDGESYPCQNFSIPQLICATKRKLQGARFGGRITTTLSQAEVTALEQDTLEVLSLLRSTKNTFAPINRIPPDVLSLIPDYWERQDMGEDLIALTHVCRGWREIFTSRPSLWTHLACADADKTRLYIERSRSLPLEIFLKESKCTSYSDDALLVAIPHINRLGSLTICVLPDTLSDLLGRFPFPAPLLRELKIILDVSRRGPAVISSTLFPEPLSPLRKLSLSNVVTDLPWRNLSNLTVFEFRYVQDKVDPLFMAQLLDFFESTPLLRKIALHDSISYSNVPPGRVVPLLHLEKLTIHGFPAHSTFLNHLSIPTDISLDLGFYFPKDSPPIPGCLTNDFDNFSHITTISLSFEPIYKRMRLNGPSGERRVSGSWPSGNSLFYTEESAFFQSLGKFDLSKTQRLAVTAYGPSQENKIEESPVFKTLLLMNNLRTLALIEVKDLSFIHALNPKRNNSRTLLCSELEELILYARGQDWPHLEELVDMASGRAEGFAKLSSITLVGLDEEHSKEEVFRLRRYVSHVEYKLDVVPPWDTVFSDGDDSECASDWDVLRFSSDDEEEDEHSESNRNFERMVSDFVKELSRRHNELY
ncbi:hypothetical protein BDM02DRAFT_3269878 [Thelephora ganbajun]|uniref:Uncharacterized protein n=1 Tax=Thelephora ganbajun TaxID=370292 RepID=A0ACB6ZFK6_THEGA|nr:hypothetical protein BDM02DRAFT_3269878 [Thelephora ganbajun]